MSDEGLHALGEAMTGAEKFDEALRTYQRAMEIAVSCIFTCFSFHNCTHAMRFNLIPNTSFNTIIAR